MTTGSYAGLDEIDGWLTAKEGRWLEVHARSCPPGSAIVEIGSYKGRSTARLAAGARAGTGAAVFAIDPHAEGTYEEFERNLRTLGLNEYVTPVRKRSEEAARDWDRPIGLLFIDGDHSPEAVERDWRLFSPHLVEGAVVAFHDSTAAPAHKLLGYPGPKAVVDRELFRSREMSRVGFAHTLTYATRRPASRRDRLRRWGVRLRKAIPDTVLLLNAHVIRRLPFFPALKRLVFGRPPRAG